MDDRTAVVKGVFNVAVRPSLAFAEPAPGELCPHGERHPYITVDGMVICAGRYIRYPDERITFRIPPLADQ